MPRVSYQESLERLATASNRGMRLGLDTTRALLAALDNPERSLRGVLVAGTNGKGSVCAMVAEIAEQAGYRVALLTKPHLTSYRERIRLDREAVSEQRFEELVDAVLAAEQRMNKSAGLPTHHELLTAMGFLAAHEHRAQLTICEVGLGGRLDATNVWDGGVAVVTSVGLDHQAQLGDTVAAIAKEKAAIIKPGDLAVSGAHDEAVPIVRKAAEVAGARLWQLEDEVTYWGPEPQPYQPPSVFVTTPRRHLPALRLGLGGAVQMANAAVAVAVSDCLADVGFPIPEAAIRSGLSKVRWPGRMESLGGDPEVIVDSAHNPHAIAAIRADLGVLVAGRRSVLLFGSMFDHDHRGMLELLSKLGFAAAVFTRSRARRAVEPEMLAGEWPDPAQIAAPVDLALGQARLTAGSGGLVLALGSIYLVGEVLASMGHGLPPDPEVSTQPLW